MTLKMVHPNNIEFRPYDTAGTLDKQYLLAGNHSFVKSGVLIIFFLTPHQPTRLDTTTPTSNRT